MSRRLAVMLQPEEPVEVALPDLIDVGAQRPARALRPPPDLAASAGEHAFQIAGADFGEDGWRQAEAVIGLQIADAGFALCEIFHEIAADMRQGAVADA